MKTFRLLYFMALLLLIQSSCNSDYSKQLPGGFVFVSESQVDQLIFNERRVNNHVAITGIPRCVINYKYDNNFIVAQQVDITENRRYIDEITQLTTIDTFYHWIIDIKNDTIYGPMSVDNYKRLFEQLSLPDALILNTNIDSIEQGALFNLKQNTAHEDDNPLKHR